MIAQTLQVALIPAVTSSAVPETERPCSDTRNITARVTSSGSSQLTGIGVMARMASAASVRVGLSRSGRISWLNSVDDVISVSTVAGHTALTVMLCGPNSRAAAFT